MHASSKKYHSVLYLLIYQEYKTFLGTDQILVKLTQAGANALRSEIQRH
jgi:hypothetical protein